MALGALAQGIGCEEPVVDGLAYGELDLIGLGAGGGGVEDRAFGVGDTDAFDGHDLVRLRWLTGGVDYDTCGRLDPGRGAGTVLHAALTEGRVLVEA